MTLSRLTWLLSFEAAVGEGAEKAKNFSNITPGGNGRSTVPPAYKANDLIQCKLAVQYNLDSTCPSVRTPQDVPANFTY